MQGSSKNPPSAIQIDAQPDEYWTTIIGPHKGVFDWRLAELWKCWDLISLFIWRDFVSLYKQTILGPLWHIIQPLLTTLTFTIIFGRIAGLSTNGAPPFLFYLAGNILWAYFSGCLTKTANTFVANSALLGKVYFHRMAIPVSIVLSNLIAFAIQFALFLIFWLAYLIKGQAVKADLWMLSAPLTVLMVAGFGLGCGIIVSALTTRYRDLAQLVTFGVQLLMFATPVIYPVSSVPEKYRWIVGINPLSPVVEAFRKGFLGVGDVTPMQLVASAAAMFMILVIGLMLFSRVERTFMDTV